MRLIGLPSVFIAAAGLAFYSSIVNAASINASAQTSVNTVVTNDNDSGPGAAFAEALDSGGEARAAAAADDGGRLATTAEFSGANGTQAVITSTSTWSETFSSAAGASARFDFFIPGGAIGFEANNVGPLEGGYSIEINFNGAQVFLATGNVLTTNNTPENPGDVSLTQTGTVIGSSFANDISDDIFGSPGAGYLFDSFAGSLDLIAVDGENTVTYTMSVFVEGLIGETSALASIGDPLDLSPNPGIVLEVDSGPVPQAVVVDIKPDGSPNSVNPRSKGVIPVAVLGSIDFDATQVDPATVTFGPGGAPPAHDGHIEDVDGNGYMDALFHFRTQETGIVCGDTEATLDGETFDGTLISGTDTIDTVGCKSAVSAAGDDTNTSTNAAAVGWWFTIGLFAPGFLRRRCGPRNDVAAPLNLGQIKINPARPIADLLRASDRLTSTRQGQSRDSLLRGNDSKAVIPA